jgi:hypothetical protein
MCCAEDILHGIGIGIGVGIANDAEFVNKPNSPRTIEPEPAGYLPVGSGRASKTKQDGAGRLRLALCPLCHLPSAICHLLMSHESWHVSCVMCHVPCPAPLRRLLLLLPLRTPPSPVSAPAFCLCHVRGAWRLWLTEHRARAPLRHFALRGPSLRLSPG